MRRFALLFLILLPACDRTPPTKPDPAAERRKALQERVDEFKQQVAEISKDHHALVDEVFPTVEARRKRERSLAGKYQILLLTCDQLESAKDRLEAVAGRDPHTAAFMESIESMRKDAKKYIELYR